MNLIKDKDFDQIIDQNDTLRKTKKIPLDLIKSIHKISDNFTTRIYGKQVKPIAAILKTLSKKIPEKNFPGDNILHPDRYLPNIKIFFYPDAVEENGAPFMFSVESHKITKNYLNFFVNSKNNVFDETNFESSEFLKNKQLFPVKENSLIVACTNGFHGRAKFTSKQDRTAIVLTFSNFKMSSLISSFSLR